MFPTQSSVSSEDMTPMLCESWVVEYVRCDGNHWYLNKKFQGCGKTVLKRICAVVGMWVTDEI